MNKQEIIKKYEQRLVLLRKALKDICSKDNFESDYMLRVYNLKELEDSILDQICECEELIERLK